MIRRARTDLEALIVPTTFLAPGIEIPRLINGCWQLAEDHRSTARPEEATLEILADLARRGLNTFDCADIYTGVEELLGRFRHRWATGRSSGDALRFHTKFVPDAATLATLDRGYVQRIIERSRRRLGVDTLDLVQFHWWDFRVPEWLEAGQYLAELRDRGWIRHLGVTNFDVGRMEALLDADVPIVSNQVQYSLLDRRPERALVDLARRRNVRLLTYGSLAGGFLAERWRGVEDPGMDLPNRSLIKYRLIIDEFGGWKAFQGLLETLQGIARKHGVSIANVATRWVLDRPEVSAVILGVSTLNRAEENLRVFRFSLDRRDAAAIGEHLSQSSGPSGEVYSLERIPRGEHAAIMKTNLNRDG